MVECRLHPAFVPLIMNHKTVPEPNIEPYAYKWAFGNVESLECSAIVEKYLATPVQIHEDGTCICPTSSHWSTFDTDNFGVLEQHKLAF